MLAVAVRIQKHPSISYLFGHDVGYRGIFLELCSFGVLLLPLWLRASPAVQPILMIQVVRFSPDGSGLGQNLGHSPVGLASAPIGPTYFDRPAHSQRLMISV
jgi:hypothetical protein